MKKKNTNEQTQKYEQKTAWLVPSKVKLSQDGSKLLVYFGPFNICSLHKNFIMSVLNNTGSSKKGA